MKNKGVFLVMLLFLFSFTNSSFEKSSLSVSVTGLRNSKGNVQFALYNKEGSIPDENYKNAYIILTAEIKNGRSTITFKDIPSGKYAINILHDENKNGKIDKGFVLPIEGIGFSNYQSIGLSNRPCFSKASFELKENKSISVKVIYL